MLKTSIRRILALVCVISLMVTNCFVLTPQVVAEAGDETPATLKSMAQEGYTVVTPQTFGVPDASYVAGETTNKEDVSINKLLFAADVTYDGTKAGNFYYLQGTGDKQVWWMQFQAGGGAIYFYNQFDYSAKTDMYRGDSGEDSRTYGANSSSNRFSLKPAEFGLTSFKETEFSFWITTEFVDAPFDDDDTADDIKIGIWVNGELYNYNGNDTYFYVLDCAENTYKGYLKHNARFAISSPVERFEDATSTMPAGYKVVTPLTFNVPDTTGAAVDASKNETLSLDKLLFAANVTRADDGTTTKTNLFYLQGPTGQNIFQLQMIPNDNRIYFYNLIDYSTKNVMYRGENGTTKAYGSSGSSNYFSLAPSAFGLTSFKGTELEIWITTEFVKAPWLTEGEADDLKIGIWINGELYKYNDADTYFYVLDCKENTYKGELRTSNAKLAISSPFMEPNDMGMIGGEYASATGEFYDSTTSNALVNKIMDGTTFHSSVRFEGEGGTLYYGSKNDANAIKLTSTEEGILVTYGAEELIVINQNSAGIPTLNNNFNLKLETKFVDCDADESTDDVQLGIYVDNKYKSFDLVDAAATLTATMGVKTTGDATVLVGDFASVTPEQVSWDLNDGAYTIEKTDSVSRLSVDGVSVDGNLELNTVGIYSVVVTKDGKVYMEDVTISGTSTDPEDPVNPPVDPEDPVDPPIDPEEPTEPTLPEITFSDFDISDDTYGYNNNSLATSGKYSEGVANKSFVGTFNFSTTNTSRIHIGGVEDGWHGAMLKGSGNTLQFSEANNRFKAVTINQDNVAISLKGNDVPFKLSIEVVNLDNDNQEDDVRFWLYFNDVLYQGKPIVEAIDYAQYLGNYLGIYSNKAASSVTIKSANLNRPKVEVDFSIVGFTKDWKQTLISTKGAASGTNSSINRAPYTGEQSTAGIYLVMSVVSLAAVAYVLWVKRSKMSE